MSIGDCLRKCCFAAALVVVGCASQQNAETTTLRSPTRDYPPPRPPDVDGRVMGADNIPAEERLEQGARVGTENHLAPGWKVEEEKGLTYDPERRKGGAIDGETKTEK